MSGAPPHRPSTESRAETLLRGLREQMRARGPATVMLFRGIAERLAVAPDSAVILDELCAELHRVHGTTGSYGLDEASALAREMELRARRWRTESRHESAERAAILERFAAELERAFEAGD